MISPGGFQYHYQRFGIAVRSAIALPGWTAIGADWRGQSTDPPATIDVTQPLSKERAATLDDGSPRLLADGAFAFAHCGLGEWLVRDPDHITLTACADADPRHLALVTQGSAIAALAYQRGWALWHASGVWHPEYGAVLFTGSSGAGKSTFAAGFTKRGWSLLCDNLCRVAVCGDNLAAYPAPGGCGCGPRPRRHSRSTERLPAMTRSVPTNCCVRPLPSSRKRLARFALRRSSRWNGAIGLS